MTPSAITLHATCVAFGDKAVLIRGKPGAGKSTLALELLDAVGSGLGPAPLQAMLVADDQAYITKAAGRLNVSAPETLRGLLEVRGLGIVHVKELYHTAELVLVVDLEPEAPRFPEPGLSVEILGVSVPLVVFEAQGRALPARLRTAFVQQTMQLPAKA